MIFGIGNDIVDIRRIADSIEKFGDRFINRIFSEVEQDKANRRKADYRSYVSTYAKRFAVKEAFMKALGTGYYNGVHFKKISVVSGQYGKPCIELDGSTKEAYDRIVGNGQSKISVSITDEYPYAFAVVVIEVL